MAYNKTNPMDRQGQIMHCFKSHLAAQDWTSYSSRKDINIIVDSDQLLFFPLMLTHVTKHW